LAKANLIFNSFPPPAKAGGNSKQEAIQNRSELKISLIIQSNFSFLNCSRLSIAPIFKWGNTNKYNHIGFSQIILNTIPKK
jgi:hypothetical protein